MPAGMYHLAFDLNNIPRLTVRELLSYSDNDPLQEIALCGAVLLGGGAHHGLCVTRSLTHSILAFLSCYPMSGQTAAIGVP